MEVSGQLHAAAALPPGKEPLVPTKMKFCVKLIWEAYSTVKELLDNFVGALTL
jgi:hypothetical protein